jgi:hypothetical protein
MIVRNERESKTNRKGKDGDHCLRHELAWLPSASSAVRRQLLLPAIGFWGQVRKPERVGEAFEEELKELADILINGNS